MSSKQELNSAPNTVSGPSGQASIEKPASVSSKVFTSTDPSWDREMSISILSAATGSELWVFSQVSQCFTSLQAFFSARSIACKPKHTPSDSRRSSR